MRELENVRDVAALQPDYMGFIFYNKSKRYVFEKETASQLPARPSGGRSMTLDLGEIEKVGVFVNEEPAEVIRICKDYGLNYAQLHGSESTEDCIAIRIKGINVIKAFSVSNEIDFEELKEYEGKVDFFLFDTKTKDHGGSGRQFDWNLLKSYPLSTRYFLSGGIGVHDIIKIIELELPQCEGIDANSRLEIRPALKDIEATRELISQIRNR
ncbi:MAG: phosphoribosylanthranilate isomerase [Flavobacteriales bacterium]|nr:phosphoribosylanthranilate isomerase [Flavobacteriales bacterium]